MISRFIKNKILFLARFERYRHTIDSNEQKFVEVIMPNVCKTKNNTCRCSVLLNHLVFFDFLNREELVAVEVNPCSFVEKLPAVVFDLTFLTNISDLKIFCTKYYLSKIHHCIQKKNPERKRLVFDGKVIEYPWCIIVIIQVKSKKSGITYEELFIKFSIVYKQLKKKSKYFEN
ncbi:U3 small nucleolar RNA-associated protein 4 [Aphis craccivora]|uniref:U3 small nucleolar RNA-associated protein 4 n=1 Tax=Aphis craccivora TaxID=307492 RepID=A0A6G0YCQ4_APHCR|nr:U3 small nucleolar RNA-associated protein 4 [Aphis craccivora]